MKKQRKKQNNRTGRQDMQDLLLPILLVLGAVPFVIRLRIYDCGLSGYDWYSQDGTTYDFYCVARSHFFVILSAVMLLVLAFRLPLYLSAVGKETGLYTASYRISGCSCSAGCTWLVSDVRN